MDTCPHRQIVSLSQTTNPLAAGSKVLNRRNVAKQTVTLIREAQNCNQRAFQELVAQDDTRIMFLALQILKNKEDAEDIYQEVILKASHNPGAFEFKSDFYAWLYRITANACYSYRPIYSNKRVPLQKLTLSHD